MFSTNESLTGINPLRTQIHRYIFLAGLMGVCIGMPLSNGINSICQAVLALNWLVEGNYVAKFKSFIRNKPALVLCSFYVMHLLGLLYTTNFSYGFEDINKKLPLFLFPLVLSTTVALSDKERKLVILTFMLAVTCSTLIGSYKLISHQLVDIHDISLFIAPVRLAMMMLLSIFLLGYYIAKYKFSIWSVISIVWIGWFIFFLLIMQSLTGIIVLLIICMLLLIHAAIKAIGKKKILLGLSVLIIFASGLIGSTVYIIHFYKEWFPKPDAVNFYTLDKKTVNGNSYEPQLWW